MMSQTKLQSETRLHHSVCTAIFLAFSFTYLYCFQDGLMTLAQQMLSHGQTHYHPLWGATIISIVLLLLGAGIARTSQVLRQMPSLRYTPSALLLGWMTCLEVNGHHHSYPKTVFFLIGIAAFACLMIFFRCHSKTVIKLLNNLSATRRWLCSLSILLLLSLTVVYMGNTNSVLHTRLRAEQSLLKNDPASAVRILNQERHTDPNLTMLRAYALALSGKLGDKLFERPISGLSAALIPSDNTDPCFLLYPTDDFFRHLGVRPRKGQGNIAYLKELFSKNQKNKFVLDYLLCAHLMEKQVDDFVRLLHTQYTIDDTLPKHYREALCLYAHQHSAPVVVYTNDVLEADYQDYQRLYSPYGEPSESLARLRETFGNTYWYYFDF